MEAKNYSADCYFRMNDLENAISIYRELLKGNKNRFTEIAALRVSKYLFNNDEQEEAIPYYLILEQVSADPSVIYNSRLNLMRSYFLTEQWNEAAKYSRIMLGESQINTSLRLEVEYANAISNYKAKNYEKAKPSLEWLVKNTTTSTGSEAKYVLAEMFFEQKAYDQSDIEIKALIKMKPSYNYWVAKGLMLQSKIFVVKDDLFQAEETLNSIIENYPNETDGIIDAAKLALEHLLTVKNVDKEIEADTVPVIELNEVEDEE
jgi:tetratricopeptide (TPR) repeat protein